MADDSPSARVGREIFVLSLGGVRVPGPAFPRFIDALTDVYLSPDEVIYREGDPTDSHYFIVSGQVSLTRAGVDPVSLGERSTLGTFDMLLGRPRKRTATATVATHVLRMPAEDWWALIEDHVDIATRIIGNTAASLRASPLGPTPSDGFPEPPSVPPPGDRAVLRRLSIVERILLLRRIPLFSTANVQALTSLAELAVERHFDDGSDLSPKSRVSRCLLAVAQGAVVASNGTLTGRFTQGSLVCGGSALDPTTEYSLSASGTTAVLAVSVEEYFDTMEEHFSLARSALVALAQEHDRVFER